MFYFNGRNERERHLPCHVETEECRRLHTDLQLCTLQIQLATIRWRTFMFPCNHPAAAYLRKSDWIPGSFLHMGQHSVPSTFLLQSTLQFLLLRYSPAVPSLQWLIAMPSDTCHQYTTFSYMHLLSDCKFVESIFCINGWSQHSYSVSLQFRIRHCGSAKFSSAFGVERGVRFFVAARECHGTTFLMVVCLCP